MLDLVNTDQVDGIYENLGFNATEVEESLAGQTEFGEYGGFDKHLGAFEFRAFESQEELDAFIEHEDYGRAEDRPGVCFGFSVTENEAKSKYELELQFNDFWIDDYNSIPLQRNEATDST